jgi:hypothetical protein
MADTNIDMMPERRAMPNNPDKTDCEQDNDAVLSGARAQRGTRASEFGRLEQSKFEGQARRTA